MNHVAVLSVALLSAIASQSAIAVTKEDIAKAYVQAITGGEGSKIAGSIDYDQLGCTPATVFDDDKCQKVVLRRKDGKAFLMEAITAENIEALVPLADLRRVYAEPDESKYGNVKLLFHLLSTRGSSWFPEFDGEGKAKAILQAQLEATGPGGMYATYVWPFDSANPSTAKITSAGVDFRISTLPRAADLDIAKFPLYYWALQTDFSEMAYPPGFPYPEVPGKPANTCRKTTAAWGHVGLQYSKSDPAKPDVTQRVANWGGGGDGSGVDDYGCGGSDVSKLDWKANTWYEYRVSRGARLGPKLWEWVGSIYEKGQAGPVYVYVIYGGEYITYATTWAELINVGCTDAKLVTRWGNPWLGNDTGRFRVGRIDLDYGRDACFRSKEIVRSACPAKWEQQQGTSTPGVHVGADQLRTSNLDHLIEKYCERPADPTEVQIARAYVQAITNGTGPKRVSAAVDFSASQCNADTVFEDGKCQTLVFNGRDGKQILIEAISPVTDGNWESSNIKSIIPEASLRSILTDPKLTLAKELFGYLSTPSDGWFDYLDGEGKPKAVLRAYIESIK